MGSSAKGMARNGMASGFMLASAVGLLALPSAVLAFSAGFEGKTDNASHVEGVETIGHSSASGNLVGPIPLRSLAKGKLYPFTPAESPSRPDRSVTVAVRVDPKTASTIMVRGRRLTIPADLAATQVRIAPTGFNLGVSRGYRNFAQSLVPPADSRKPDLSDMSRFSIAAGINSDDSHFNPRITMDDKHGAGRSSRGYDADRDGQADLGGSLSVTRNLDVTAGVRNYSQDRDRLRPLTDGKQDNQAVYVGTQFRF